MKGERALSNTNGISKPVQKKNWGSIYVWNIVACVLATIVITACVQYFKNKYLLALNPLKPLWPDLLLENAGNGVIGFVVGILIGTAAIIKRTSQYIDLTLKKLRVEQSTLKEQVVEIIEKTLPVILKGHKINITGVHRGKPAGAALIAKAKLPDDHLDGLLIMEDHTSENHYAEHCKKVIAHNGIEKIYSMSDFGLDLTFHMFCEAKRDYNKNIIKWITDVNKEVKTEIKRIQVLTEGRYLFLKKLIIYKHDNTKWKDLIKDVRPSIRRQYEKDNVSLIEDEVNAKLLANNLINGYEWYCSNYACVDIKTALDKGKIERVKTNTNESVKWAVFTRESLKWTGIKINEVTPGEFIIFNENVLVRYFQNSMLSETLTGKIVDPFLIAFTDEKCWKNQITLRLLFFGFGNYDDSILLGEYSNKVE